MPIKPDPTGALELADEPGGAASSRDEALLLGQIKVLEMVATGAPLSEVLDAGLRFCEAHSPDMLGSILLLDTEGKRLHHGAAPSLPPEYMRAIDGSSIGPRAGSCGTAAFRAEPVVVEDIASDPLWTDYRELALPFGLRACWSTPIFDEQHRVLGTFAIYYRHPGLPTDWHLRLIGIVTHLAAIAISHRRIQEALRTSEIRQRRLVEANVIGIIILGVQGAIKEANDHFLRMLGYAREDLEAGRLDWNALTPSGWEAVDRVALQEMVSTGASVPFEKEFLHKESRRVPVRASVTRLEGPGSDCICLIEDLTPRKRAEEERQRVFERISDAFVALDKDWRYTHVNEKAGQFFGRAPQSLIGKHIWTEFPEGVGQPFHRAYEKAMAEQTPVMLEEYYPPYDKWFENRIYPSPEGLTIYFHDITLRKQAEQALKQSHADLERRIQERTAELAAKNKELETFSYSVSHDLKAPLRGIDGYSKLLSDEYGDKLDEEGRRFLANIRTGTAQMHQLIDDMLVYSRLDRRALAIGPLDLKATVDRIIRERQFDLSQVQLTTDIAPGSVLADREGLMMAIRNVLDNAIKFSQKRSPPIIEIRSRVEGGRHILSIRDNGTGFMMKHHSTIFQIFQRLHRSEEYGGTGVGLAIVRKAMDRMGGKVWAESEPDKGAVFHLDLPCARGAQDSGAA